jgi:hypothetical protein
MGKVGYVTDTKYMRNAYEILAENPEGRTPETLRSKGK